MSFSFDLVALFTMIGAVLLIVGALPFTPVVVGVLILLSLFKFSMTFGES